MSIRCVHMALGLALLASATVVCADAPVVQGHPLAAVSNNDNAMNYTGVATPTAFAPEQALVTADDTDNEPNANKHDLVSQVSMLQEQLQDLRGQYEVQAHTLAQMQQQINQLSGTKPATLTAPSHAENSTQTTAVLPAEKNVAPAAANAGVSEDEMYQQAYKMIAAKQYTQATVALQSYLQDYPAGVHAATSHYWLGELALIEGNPSQAQNQFNIVVTQFPQSPKAADAMLKIGMIYYNQAQWKQARTQFTALTTKYPTSASAQLAQQQLQQMRQQGN